MHTGFVPNPNVEHPSYGSLIAQELATAVPSLEIPPFVSVGGGSVALAFSVQPGPRLLSAHKEMSRIESEVSKERLASRLQMLAAIENRFIKERRGNLPLDHREIAGKSVQLMSSSQLAAFKVSEEPASVGEIRRDEFWAGLLDGVVWWKLVCLLLKSTLEAGTITATFWNTC